MQLSDLLDELREGILHDTSDQIAGVSDKLWSDARLVRYIDEAQKRWSRLSFTLRDGKTPEVCEVILRTGVSNYDLHPSVLGVLSVRMDGDKADLPRAGHSQFNAYTMPDTYFFDPSALSAIPDGKPVAFSTDDYIVVDDDGEPNQISLRVYPAPSSTYNLVKLRLRVVRLPLNPLTTANLNAHPEVPSIHHMDMLDWAAYLALRKVDVDVLNPQIAATFKKTFEDNVKIAKRDLMRKVFTPAQWAFGRNGFSWEK